MPWAEWKDILKRGFGRGTCPHQLGFLLESSLRRFVLSPEELAQRLELSAAAQVLELGPGPGYFSRARLVVLISAIKLSPGRAGL